MRVRYGTYTHEEGEVSLSISRDAIETEGGDIIGVEERWTLTGNLIASSETAMNSSVQALLTAYNRDGKDLALLLSSGADSALVLRSQDCDGGTKVIQRPSFPDFRGPAYTGYLPYSIAVMGTRDTTGGEDGLISWTEQISREGGGPRFGMRETLNGYPIKQQLRQATIYRVKQSGQATGRYSYPTPASPLWPAALMEAPKVTHSTPTRRGSSGRRQYVDWTVSWEYSFESAVPLRGSPSIWR